MNLQRATRVKATALLLIVITLAILSCSEDEKLGKTLAVITFPESSLSNSHRTWIFLTDDAGTQLGAALQAEEGVDLVFERPKDFKGNSFTLHKVMYKANVAEHFTDFYIYSYTGVKAGTFSLPKITTPIYNVIGEANVVVNNVPAVYQPRIIGAGVLGANFSGSGGTFNVKTLVLENNKWMVCYVSGAAIDGRVPRYAYFNSVNTNETKTISFTDLPEASHKTITFDSEVEMVQVTVGLPGGMGNMDFYGIYNTTTAPVYYPAEVTDDFSSSIALYNGNDYQAYYRIGSIPTAMKTLPATINSLDVAEHEVSITTTGSYDYLMLYSSEFWEDEDWSHVLTWRVHMNDAEDKHFIIPVLPEVITADYAQLENIPLNFELISLMESDRHAGYADFLQENLKGDQPLTQPATETLVFRKVFPSIGKQAGKVQPERFEIRPSIEKINP